MSRFAGVMLAIATLLAGCGGGEGTSVPVYTESGERITVQVGDEFVIRLPSNPSTGFEWFLEDLPAAVRLVSTHYDPPSVQIPGRGGHQELRVRARTPGTVELELHYARSFEPDVAPARTAVFDLRIS